MTILYRVAGSLAAVSALGSFLIILSGFLVKPLRQHPHSLVVLLSLCDFFLSWKWILTTVFPDSSHFQYEANICLLQAVWAQFWGLASASWNAMISLNLIIKLRSPFKNTAPNEKYYHFWVWSLSCITTGLLYFFQWFGPSGDQTCWFFRDKPLSQLLILVPLFVYVVIAFMALILFIKRIRYIVEDRRILMRMVLYVSFFILFWSGPIIHQIAIIIQFYVFRTDDDEPEKNILVWLDIIGICSQGLANSIVWVTNPTFFKVFREKILVKLCKCFLTKDERLPLVPSFLEESLSDEKMDINMIDVMMRKNIINGILLGIQHSVVGIQKDGKEGNLRPESMNFEEIIAHEHRNVELHSFLRTSHASVFHTPTANSKTEHLSNERTIPKKNESQEQQKQQQSDTKTEKEPLLSSDLLGADFDYASKQSTKKVRTVSFIFTDYAPKVFNAIRIMNQISVDEYLSSLDPVRFMVSLSDHKFSEGRSGSFFVFSPDKKFIIKTVTKAEAELLFHILPKYYGYLLRNPQSFIVRFYGLHCMEYMDLEATYCVVMENVFHTNLKIHEKYDLKGSWVARQAGKKHEKDRSVLGLDLDLKRTLRLAPQFKSQFLYIIQKDVSFLQSVNIMDYSILLGFHFVDSDSATSKTEQMNESDPSNKNNPATENLTMSINNKTKSSLESKTPSSSPSARPLPTTPKDHYELNNPVARTQKKNEGREKGIAIQKLTRKLSIPVSSSSPYAVHCL
jgi:hypothetical protein